MLNRNATLIKGGMVYDPETNTFTQMDLAYQGRKLVEKDELSEDYRTVDAEGCIVTCGLTDMHIHAAQSCSDTGIGPDPVCLPAGVTTAVDAGTTGCASFRAFYGEEMMHSRTDIKACLHVSPAGMTTLVHMEESDPAYYCVDGIKELFEKFPERLVGLKTRASKGFIDSEKPLLAAIDMAEVVGCPLVVHANDPVISMEEFAGMLRPGDILCHVYHGIGDTILNEHGKVKDGILKARERGVLFDVAHGRGNFNLKVAEAAIKDGFIPDMIGTDMTVFVQNQAPVYSLPYVMSKIHCLGVPWTEVFRAVTQTPAQWLGEPKKACLSAGAEANLAIFKIKKRIIRYEDAFGNFFDGNEILIPQMTVIDGEILFRQMEFQ